MKWNRDFLLPGQAILAALFLLLALVAGAAGFQLVSVIGDNNLAPASANGDSYFPVLSADGRFVLYASTANNLTPSNQVPGPRGMPHWFNVYLHDCVSGTNALVSVNLAGTAANGDSQPDAISTNGQFALFESMATDLVSNSSRAGVFIRDLINGTTTLVNVNTNGVACNRSCSDAAMTPDGRFVVFASAANDLVTNDVNGISDIFVRDMQAGTTALVSAGAESLNLPFLYSSSFAPAITPDGRYVVFFSTAKNLVPGVTSPGEVYVRDLQANTTLLASTNARSLFKSVFGTTNAFSYNQAISADGRYVSFEVCNNAGSYVSASPRGLILHHDVLTGLTQIVHTNANVPTDSALPVIRSLDMTPDGRFITFLANDAAVTGKTVVYRWDALTGENTLVSADQNGVPVVGWCESPVIDASGRYVAFACQSLSPAGSGNNLYVRDVQTGVTRLVDVDTNGASLGNSAVFALSADGRSLAFDSADPSLVPGDGNQNRDVFVRDLETDTTSLISAHLPALPVQSPSGFCKLFDASVSTNGRFVAFTSDADNVVANDTNQCRDVFVRDLLLGTNLLVSVGTNGMAAWNSSWEPAISGDGRYVAFSSFATNLVPGGPARGQNVFVRDLLKGSNILVSANVTGGFAGSRAFSPLISADGNFVLFRSLARNLTYDLYPTTEVENLFLRNLQSKTTYALTTNAFWWDAAMTADGRSIAFPKLNVNGLYTLAIWNSQAATQAVLNLSFSLGIIPSKLAFSPDGRWLTYLNSGLYAYDLVGKSNRLICAGTTSFRLRSLPKFSADSRFITYSTDTKVLRADTNLTFDIYLYDVQKGTNYLISRSFNSTNAANGLSDSPCLSSDGQFLVYRSLASNLVPDDKNQAADLFMYDRLSGATTLISVNQAGNASANACSQRPVFSGDGKTLFFQSYASDLTDQVLGESGAIFKLDLAPATGIDSDGDGLADAWELEHFQTLDRDGTADFDNDGASDGFEFATGTDPADPQSKFAATLVENSSAGQNPTLTWPAVAGKSYRVQFKTNLADTDWQDLNGVTTLMGHHGQAIDLAPAAGQRFYRVVLNN